MYQLQSLERALDLLDTLGREPRSRLQDLCYLTSFNQSTVLRTLRVLERYGMVHRSSDGHHYTLGTRLAELGRLAVSAIDVPADLRPEASALARRYAATVHVGLYRGEGVAVIDKVDARDSLVRYSSLGTQLPLHASAAGKAVLALLYVDNLAELGVRAPLAAHTQHSITDVPRLAADVRESRERGYSIEREEFQLGFACVGAAVSIGDDVYAVSISGPIVTGRELAERGERLAAVVAAFAAQRGAVARTLASNTSPENEEQLAEHRAPKIRR